MKKHILLALCFSFITCASTAQSISNVKFEQSGKQIAIYYDLSGEAGSSYGISVYCAQDGSANWGAPLISVNGDVGNNIKPGINKKIYWNVLNEKENLIGDIRFKIESIMDFTGAKGSFVDTRDGKNYKWIRVGEQIWMAENLNYIAYKGSWCYGNKTEGCNIFGRLYNWQIAQNICPQGWHIPSKNEWEILCTSLFKLKGVTGGGLKEPGSTHWKSPNSGAIYQSGFNALPGGARDPDGLFYYIGEFGYWWAAPGVNNNSPVSLVLNYSNPKVIYNDIGKNYGFSVRCLKD